MHRVAIIGSGPAGFYAAEALLKRTDAKVDVDHRGVGRRVNGQRGDKRHYLGGGTASGERPDVKQDAVCLEPYAWWQRRDSSDKPRGDRAETDRQRPAQHQHRQLRERRLALDGHSHRQRRHERPRQRNDEFETIIAPVANPDPRHAR